jgi:hypothetical protein
MQQSERPWTLEAVHQLIELAREQVPVRIIGARLQRDPDEILSKLLELGITVKPELEL